MQELFSGHTMARILLSFVITLITSVPVCSFVASSVSKIDSIQIRHYFGSFIPVRSSSFDDEDYYNEYEHAREDSSRSSSTSGNVKVRRSRRPIIRSSQNKALKSRNSKTAEGKKRHEEALKDPTLLSSVRFDNNDRDINPQLKRSIIEEMGFQQMTDIQAKTYSPIKSGHSVIGRARTGTGKTVAFLLPALERLLENINANSKNSNNLQLYRAGSNIGILIVAPTRELAIQISDQAKLLLQHTNTHANHSWNVLCIYGGTKIGKDIHLLNQRIPTILVSTPGRLLDHLHQQQPSKITRVRGRTFKQILGETKIVVLDETDRLLEEFYKETMSILSYLPRPEKRQTLLFSATLSYKLRNMIHDNGKRHGKQNATIKNNKTNNNHDKIISQDFIQVDCGGGGANGDAADTVNKNKDIQIDISNAKKAQPVRPSKNNNNSNIPVRIDQSYVQLQSMDIYISALFDILQHSTTSQDSSKIVVFFPTAKLVKFCSNLFTTGFHIPVYEMHSRMSQSSRNRISQAFRNTNHGILFTTDVSARGVDYPDVTHVIQYGAPDDENGYIHRLGRTGRAGKSGKGLLVLLPMDNLQNSNNKKNNYFFSSDNLTRKNNISKNDVIQQLVDNGDESNRSRENNNHDMITTVQRLIRSNHITLTPSAQDAYTSIIAHYIPKVQDHKKQDILRLASDFATNACGLPHLPAISEKLQSKLKL